MKTTTFFLTCLALPIFLTARPAPPCAPYSYHEGFENEEVKLQHWASNGEAEILFNGNSDEKAFSGKKCHKFEIVITSGSYHYYGVKLPLACEGKLRLNAKVWLGEGSTARVGFGTNMLYPPTRHSGCGSAEAYRRPTGGWKTVSMDLVERGQAGCDSVLRKHTTTLTGKNAGAVLDYWSLFVRGKPGDRAVVYIDDVEIKGEIPEKQAYEAWLANRLDKAKADFLIKLKDWEKEYDTQLAKLPKTTNFPALQPQLDRLRKEAAQFEELLSQLRKQGYARQDKLDSLQTTLARLRGAPENLRFMEKALLAKKPFILLAINNPLTDNRPDPGLPPYETKLGGDLAITACRGETESVSAVAIAIKPVTALTVRLEPFTGPAGRIPASAADLRLLKWWYQGEGGIGYSPKRVYKAELLLKDAKLIRVDTKKEENYLRHTAPDGSVSYRLCSGKESANLAGIRPIDAEELQPVDLPAGGGQEFWLNLKVPENAAPGTYSSELVFTAGNVTERLPVHLHVPAFELPPSPLVYSIYYRAKIADDGQPTITSEFRSPEQYRAEIADMRDHGVLYPTNYQNNKNPAALRQVLEIRRELGLPTEFFYNLGLHTGSTTDPARLATLRENVREWVGLCNRFGYREIYFYGIDEAKGDRLKAQKTTWKTVQQAGGKTFVACYKKTFEAMGNLLNCAVLASRPDPDEAKKWHSVGSQAFCYAYPQVGEERPATYRRNFGLVLWKAGFDGAMDYAYQHGFTHVWNDFDDHRYRDHNFTYPTVNGIVGTIQWEGFREAVDDTRYLRALQLAIDKANNSPEAKQAAAWLEALNPVTCDLPATRTQMINWINKLR